MLKIHGVPVSVHTRKVIVVALSKGLDYENLPVVPVMPHTLPSNWRDISPTGKIPALQDGDFTVGDSSAICAYLDRQFPGQPIYPAESRDYARTLFLEQYAGTLFTEVVRPLFHETFVHPRLQNIPADAKRVQDVLSRVVPEQFGYLESQLHDEYLVGNQPTVADYAVISNLVTYRYLGFGIFPERFPRLNAYFDRMLLLPALREAMKREEATVDSMKLTGTGMFRIGDFSRIARVSARLLRFYDEIGLFVPAHADPQSGYRFYTVAQLAELNRILVLKDLGFNLDQVREIVSKKVDPAELRNMLLLRRNDVEQTLAAESQRLRQIETRIAQIEMDGALTADDVVVRAEPAYDILSLRRTVPSFVAARALIGELREQAKPLLPKGGLALMAVAHSPYFEADEIDVEFGFVLPAGSDLEPLTSSSLRRRTLEAVDRLAVCVRIGLPEDAHLITAKIGRFLEASGEALAGPSREVFLKPPNPERMHESVVEMQFSVGPST